MFYIKDRISHIGPEELVHHLINQESKNSRRKTLESNIIQITKNDVVSKIDYDDKLKNKLTSNLQAYIFWHNR